MSLMKLLVLSCLILLFKTCQCSPQKSIVVNHMPTLNPVNWTSKSLTLIIENDYMQLSQRSLSLEDPSWLESADFYISRNHNLIYCDRKTFLTYLNPMTGASANWSKIAASRVITTVDGDGFWQFDPNYDNENGSLTNLLRKVDLNGKPLPEVGKILQKFRDSDFWRVDSVFQVEGRTYAAALLGSSTRSLRFTHYLLRISDDQKPLTSSFRALLMHTEKHQDEVFLTKHDGEYKILRGHANGRNIIMYSLEDIDNNMDKTIRDPQCFDFEEMLKINVQVYCSNLSLPAFHMDPKIAKIMLLGTEFSQISMAIDIGDQIDQTLLISSKNSENLVKISRCYLNAENSCLSYKFNKTEADGILDMNRVGLDTKKGLIVVPRRFKARQAKYFLLPLFDCEAFSTCDSCEIIGFYHGCKWDKSACRKVANASEPFLNKCFNILEAVYHGRDPYHIEVKTDYQVNLELDWFSALVNEAINVPLTYEGGLFVGSVKGSVPTVIVIKIGRSTGGWMIAQAVVARKSPIWISTVVPLSLTVLVAVVAILLVMVLRQRAVPVAVNKKSSLGDQEKAIGKKCFTPTGKKKSFEGVKIAKEAVKAFSKKSSELIDAKFPSKLEKIDESVDLKTASKKDESGLEKARQLDEEKIEKPKEGDKTDKLKEGEKSDKPKEGEKTEKPKGDDKTDKPKESDKTAATDKLGPPKSNESDSKPNEAGKREQTEVPKVASPDEKSSDVEKREKPNELGKSEKPKETEESKKPEQVTKIEKTDDSDKKTSWSPTSVAAIGSNTSLNLSKPTLSSEETKPKKNE